MTYAKSLRPDVEHAYCNEYWDAPHVVEGFVADACAYPALSSFVLSPLFL